MLADLLEVDKRVLKTLANGGHATQGSALELLALEQTLAILQEAHVITSHGLNQRLGGGQLAQGDAEMAAVILAP